MNRKELKKILFNYYSKDGVSSILSSRIGIKVQIAGELWEKYQIPPNIWGKKNRNKLLQFLGENERIENA
ncbi:hypothetical protein [Campylobacter estrildidarum]|uniref:Uncharacterized protein n=1 Tax=Campylobacter estrildidarum TaxID=2510189 RepID=A0A4U7BNM3_9BACT|nr:hypothetical protein [Campylobacter estrildidarum]TKX30506.1 hypothetical protein CQA69_06425 [Campylobacter estrildidarum]